MWDNALWCYDHNVFFLSIVNGVYTNHHLFFWNICIPSVNLFSIQLLKRILKHGIRSIGFYLSSFWNCADLNLGLINSRMNIFQWVPLTFKFGSYMYNFSRMASKIEPIFLNVHNYAIWVPYMETLLKIKGI